MDGVKQQDSTPQNDSTLGFKWIKKNRTKYIQIEKLRSVTTKLTGYSLF
jgi:hypothetical protein